MKGLNLANLLDARVAEQRASKSYVWVERELVLDAIAELRRLYALEDQTPPQTEWPRLWLSS